MKLFPYNFSSFLIFILTFLILLLLLTPLSFSMQNAWGALTEKPIENLPFPFLVIKSKMAKVRFGPGAYYPVKFVFLKSNIPIMVINNFDDWHQIKDIEGQTGWVHQSLISKKSYALTKNFIFGYQNATVLAKKTVQIDENILVYVKKCYKDWCYIWVEGHKCWVQQANLWGVNSPIPLKAGS